jgi:hypothetical protein
MSEEPAHQLRVEPCDGHGYLLIGPGFASLTPGLVEGEALSALFTPDSPAWQGPVWGKAEVVFSPSKRGSTVTLLEGGETRWSQVLPRGASISILWAGDLDRDGRVDLLVDYGDPTSWPLGTREPALHLSSVDHVELGRTPETW